MLVSTAFTHFDSLNCSKATGSISRVNEDLLWEGWDYLVRHQGRYSEMTGSPHDAQLRRICWRELDFVAVEDVVGVTLFAEKQLAA